MATSSTSTLVPPRTHSHTRGHISPLTRPAAVNRCSYIRTRDTYSRAWTRTPHNARVSRAHAGHFLGNYKSKFGIKRERAPFVFTPDFARVLGDKGHSDYEHFVALCCRAYNILRGHSHEFITLFQLMLSTGIPELQRADDIFWVRDCLRLGKSETQATAHSVPLSTAAAPPHDALTPPSPPASRRRNILRS